MKGNTSLLICCLIGASFLGYFGLRYKSSDTQSELMAQEIIPEQSGIFAVGRLEPKGEILTISGLLGSRVAEIAVQEGDWVEKGQILAFLSDYQVQLSRRNFAASRVRELFAQFQAEMNAAKIQVQESQAQLRLIDQPQASEIEAQQAVLEGAKVELENSTIRYERYRQLRDNGAISDQALEDQRLLVEQAQTKVEQAQATFDRLTYSRLSSLQKANITVNYSQANLEQIRNRIPLESAQRELELAEAQLEQTIIRAPESGKILKVFTHPGEAIDSQGLLELGDTRNMYAIAEVYETDITMVKVGQVAKIHSPVFDKPLLGYVERIGQSVYKNRLVSDDPGARSDSRIIEVAIKLKSSSEVAALSRLQVDVEIDL